MATITLPAGLLAREVYREDASAIMTLANQADMAEIGQGDTTVEDVYELWDKEKVDLTRNACAITTSGEIIGYTGVAVTRQGIMLDVHTNVHPAYQHLPIASYLLQFANERTLALLAAYPETPHRLYSWSFIPTKTAVLVEDGFTIEESDYEMEIILDQEPEAPRPLSGIIIRPFVQGQEEEAVYAVIAEAFPDIDGKPYKAYADWYENVFVKTKSFDPSMLYVAVAGTQLVGTISCRIYPENAEGFIWQVAIRRAWRQQGIAQQLLRTAFSTYYQRGMRRILLTVNATNATGAHQLYTSVGMHKYVQFDSLAKVF
ncbi:hypothetical protein KDA_01910 [Dictyobacter alpinus]|uniref:N-acetyltransferase domain-containing protein n=1 Tax=Dictyobacter alpinus TaxID=2014873 RepID=A0A402B066_9CHLR|nr:GNAT family N-acetyltransferase [Dictyobacter alpinus]GCE24707.1 hypothetical protein KDA_01910 [Dictyobacter alpinus]